MKEAVAQKIRWREIHELRQVQCIIALVLAIVGLSVSAGAQELEPGQYELNYHFELDPKKDRARVTIELGKASRRVVELRIRINPEHHVDLEVEGEFENTVGGLVWTPPVGGGSLSYTVPITHRRRNGAYDAYIGKDWAIFRGDDFVPPVSVRSKLGSQSRAKLFFQLPRGWSAVTPYRPSRFGGFNVVHPDRRFDRPTGWILVGKFGQRIDEIRGTRVVIAAPKDQQFHRMDILAFMRWNLPTLKKVFPDYPARILIIGAGDPMWRGGLSGPGSLFLHASRPIISENGTSTLLHEMVHTALRISSDDDDWIVEGLAEFYALEFMRRSGTLSTNRYKKTLESLATWGKDVKNLRTKNSQGAVTARAVGIFRALDQELRQVSDRQYNLDHVAQALAQQGGKVDLDLLRGVAESLVNKELKSLGSGSLPGLE